MNFKNWENHNISSEIINNILYLLINDSRVTALSIQESNEALIDLLEIKNPRLKPFSDFDSRFQQSYEGYSKVRSSVADKVLKMLDFLPSDIGIAFSEGFRPIHKQKEYFDKKLRENLLNFNDKEQAYQETCKSVSPPFIENTPPHCAGAAIDISLFHFEKNQSKLLDMGEYDTIFGENLQQETFSKNTTPSQRENRLILLEAALKAGFVNYGHEWWHYSYGDKAWAYVKGQKYALYDLMVSKTDPILFLNKQEYLKDF